MANEQSPQRKPANLSVDQMKRGIARLDQRITDLESFDVNTVLNDDGSTLEGLIHKVNSTLQDILGCDSLEYDEYKIFTSSVSFFFPRADPVYIQSIHKKNITSAVHKLQALKEVLEERVAHAVPSQNQLAAQPSPIPNTGKVFIVHGHEPGVLNTVARFIEKLGLEPVILHEQPNENRTVIEKLEDHSEADFAIVLFTPDDIGHPAKHPEKAKPRARQNVVLELGYFMGKLGRNRVALLQVGDDIEIPSDYSGVLYLPFNDNGAWKYLLAKEMKARGINIDLNKV